MMQYDEILPEDLDGNGNMSVTAVDHSVLNEAEANNVALDELENFSPKEAKKTSKPTEENETWQNLDIRLSDVINSFIETSEQPAFLVRDDNLVYVNEAGLAILGFSTDKEVLGVKFLNFVFQEDWSKLAENIGEMLTNGKTVKFNLRNQNGKLKEISFQAVYLPEIEHFSFILVGKTPKKVSKPTINNLYDEITGLPSFFLFEDRVLVAISAEKAKTNSTDKRMLAVVAININNMASFYKMRVDELILKKVADSLVVNLPKNATVALGLKYHFWVLLPDLKTPEEINKNLQKIVSLLQVGVKDNLTRHELLFSIGVSIFPTLGNSPKKVIEQALSAVKTSQIKKIPVVIFDPRI